MGGTNYSDTVYRSRIDDHKASGTSVFTHDADVRAGRVDTQVHAKLDPAGKNTLGLVIRESLDSDVHPTSRAIVVLFDESGSMGKVPKRFVLKLDKLMAMLVKKGYVEHPHVLFGGIGDATSDRVPLQIGQFEGGNEMDEALSLIYLEGNGGGQRTESYELAMYFMARHTEMDCLTKRGDKGYLFIIGDETPYPQVKRSEVKRLIGDKLEADIPTEAILTELREKFEVFWVHPMEGSYTHDPVVVEPMQKLFGQNWLQLEHADDVCELIASTIGVNEGFDLHDVTAHLKDIGAGDDSVGRVSTALAAYAGAKGGLTKASVSDGSLTTSGSDDVARL